MSGQIDTVVIGAGQAGLATSYHLTQSGREHVVLERGDVADTWRTKRWDGFYLNTPKWTQALPGHEYDGPEPDAFCVARGDDRVSRGVRQPPSRHRFGQAPR